MIDNPKILSAVEAAFGPDVVCFKGAYVPKKSKPKGEQVRRTALHMDYGIGEGQSDYRNSNALWVNVACYLTDMTFEHGPFAVVPGSNHRNHLVPGTDMEEMKDEAVTILAKAGDAVLFLHNTAHAGGVNVSGTTQHILFCSYRPRWSRPIGRGRVAEDFPRQSPSRSAAVNREHQQRHVTESPVRPSAHSGSGLLTSTRKVLKTR
jgi:hypothetical protein